jgi:hypothetical protein
MGVSFMACGVTVKLVLVGATGVTAMSLNGGTFEASTFTGGDLTVTFEITNNEMVLGEMLRLT